MMIGPRRGEILALRVRDILFDTGVVNLDKSYVARGGIKRVKDTKTHQSRQPALDEDTLGLLRAYIERVHARREAVGLDPDSSAFLFSYQADHSQPCHPDGVTYRYARMCRRILAPDRPAARCLADSSMSSPMLPTTIQPSPSTH